MDCDRCGGTGEIPLLGPNTTSCPDCEDTTSVLKWQFVASEDQTHDSFDFQSPVHFTVEDGDVIVVDFDQECVTFRYAHVFRTNDHIELDRLKHLDPQSFLVDLKRTLRNDKNWEKIPYSKNGDQP